MTVLMTAARPYPIDGSRCRIEWQGLTPDHDVSVQVVTPGGPGPVFPAAAVPGLREQAYAPPGNWLLDLGAVGADVRRLDFVVASRRGGAISAAAEVGSAQPGVIADVYQHPGLTTLPEAPMIALRIERGSGSWVVTAFDSVFVDDQDFGPRRDVPKALQEAVVQAKRERVVENGEPVTAVLDVSASMRPRLLSGTVASVLTGLQAIAGAADQREVHVVAVSDRAYGPRQLGVADDAAEFLRAWVAEIGLRSGVRQRQADWLRQHSPSGLVVVVSDEETPDGTDVPAGRRRQIVLLPPDAEPTPGGVRAGTVVFTEERPAAGTVVNALAHAHQPLENGSDGGTGRPASAAGRRGPGRGVGTP